MCEVGRVVASFGALEEVLLRTIFAITGTQRYEQVTEDDVRKWIASIESSARDSLKRLINRLENELRKIDDPAIDNWPDLISDMRDVNVYRDIVCHGSWKKGSKPGAWRPFFVNTKGQVYEGDFTVETLQEIRRAVKSLISDCINLVSMKGYQFPGSRGPGKPIMEVDRAD